MKPSLVLGLMSGTSIDSVDYALCAINADQIRLRDYWQVDFPPALQARLHRAARGGADSHEVGQLHHDLGRFYALHARRQGSPRPQLVGLHGQTIFHNPSPKAPATLQLGEPAWLAEALRVPVVSNFRAGDIAAGGQGAPLATLFHQRVFGRPGHYVCVNNLGGISNVTALDWRRGRAPRVLAFDTGPANVLIDMAMRHFTRGKLAMDRDGAWAARGTPAEGLLAGWLKLAYFRQAPPKSTGREFFGEPFFQRALRQVQQAGLSRFDMLATLTEFTARSLALNYRLHLPAAPQRVILTGGGASNPTLAAAIARCLRQLAPAVEVQTGDEAGWPTQSIEPAAFALLAWCRIQGKPGNLPATTGAARPVLLGQITEP